MAGRKKGRGRADPVATDMASPAADAASTKIVEEAAAEAAADGGKASGGKTTGARTGAAAEGPLGVATAVATGEEDEVTDIASSDADRAR